MRFLVMPLRHYQLRHYMFYYTTTNCSFSGENPNLNPNHLGFQVTLSKETSKSFDHLLTLTAISLGNMQLKEKHQLCNHPRSFL